ncbi:site-specific integrase [Acidiplasma sp.]|uniref:site-specific integrase n=1 Tax=Acidiplasma sp. TaxID=1872114 RepID=UPI00258CA4CC|nr:site-specific integrase [Acidiplasma sp.]
MDIYSIDRDLNAEYKRINKIPEKERKTIISFVKEIKITGITQHREYFYLTRLRVIYNNLQDKFLNPGKEDIIDIILKFKKKYTDKTMIDYENVMKRFYKWYYGKLPDFMDIKFNHKSSHDKKIDLITKYDIEKLINACNNTRDKALVSLLYDSGCRIGEILTLRMRDVIFDEYGLILNVHGKTGNRNVRIIGDSIAYLKDYLKSKDDNDEYLFTGLQKQNMHKQMKYYDARKLLINLKARTGIERRIYPHLFRHTRASILASKVPESPLESQMGWVHGSKMTSIYVHLSMRDQDNAILKAYGININEKNEIEEKPKKCPRCDYLNPSNAKYCHNCLFPFDEKSALEYENKEKEIEDKIEKSNIIPGIAKKMIENAPESFKSKLIENVLEEILKDPEMLKKFRNEVNGK